MRLYSPLEVPKNLNSKGLPGGMIFQIAPKTRGFQNKFQKAEIYVLDE